MSRVIIYSWIFIIRALIDSKFIFQHIMLLIRFLISCLIPDKPQWVATEMAKVEFARREAVNRLSSATTTPPSSGTAIIIPNSNNSSCDIQDTIFTDDLKLPVATEGTSRR